MNSRQFEELVCRHFQMQEYKTSLTSQSGDYGVDVFAIKGTEKIAIQAKMYGGSTRKINRETMMKLYGAKAYFDCSKAIIATNGKILEDAIEVANKLDIEIIYLETNLPISKFEVNSKINYTDFATIWEKYILPLEGQTLSRDNEKSNKIVKVDWSGIKRISSKNKPGNINIEIFKEAVNKLLTEGFITRDYINQNYLGRASSGVILILSQVPFFKLTDRPKGLQYIK